MVKYIILNDAKHSFVKYEVENGFLMNAYVLQNLEWRNDSDIEATMNRVVAEKLEAVVGKSLTKEELVDELVLRIKNSKKLEELIK